MSPEDPKEPLEDVDAEEQEAAARLALALEGRSARDVPPEALEAALLLRVLEDGELSPAREAALLDELTKALPEPSERPRRIPWPWLLSALGMGALLVVIGLDRLETEEATAGLPEPDVALLAAQAARLQGPETEEYRTRLADYRQQVLAAARGGIGR